MLTKLPSAMLQPGVQNAVNLMDRRFGVVGDGVADDTVAIQAVLAAYSAVFIPDGIYKTTDVLLLDDYATLYFESRNAIIQSTSTTAILRGRGHTTYRNRYITIYNGQIDGLLKGRAIALDFTSTSHVRVFGLFIKSVYEGIHHGGTGSLGAFYNNYFGCDIQGATCAIRNGSLGNEIGVWGGQISGVDVGTDDDDNSGANYYGVAIEGFDVAGHRVSISGDAAISIRFWGSRLENSPDPEYVASRGFDIRSAAQDAHIMAPGIGTVAFPIVDVGTRTSIMYTNGPQILKFPWPTVTTGLPFGAVWSNAGILTVHSA